MLAYGTAAVQIQRCKVRCDVLPHPQSNSYIHSKIDVLAVTENLWWVFDTVEIQIRGKTDERLFEFGSKLEL